MWVPGQLIWLDSLCRGCNVPLPTVSWNSDKQPFRSRTRMTFYLLKLWKDWILFIIISSTHCFPSELLKSEAAPHITSHFFTFSRCFRQTKYKSSCTLVPSNEAFTSESDCFVRILQEAVKNLWVGLRTSCMRTVTPYSSVPQLRWRHANRVFRVIAYLALFNNSRSKWQAIFSDL